MFFLLSFSVERLDYLLTNLNEVQKRYGSKIAVMYSVACKIRPALQVRVILG